MFPLNYSHDTYRVDCNSNRSRHRSIRYYNGGISVDKIPGWSGLLISWETNCLNGSVNNMKNWDTVVMTVQNTDGSFQYNITRTVRKWEVWWWRLQPRRVSNNIYRLPHCTTNYCHDDLFLNNFGWSWGGISIFWYKNILFQDVIACVKFLNRSFHMNLNNVIL